MKISDFNRCAFIGAAVVALLAGCGPSQSPIGGLGPTNTSRERTQKTSSGGDLIYAAPDFTTYEVNIFTYPAGKFVADFKPPGFPGGLCSDAHGNVFMTDFESGSTDVGNVDEYAHGATSPSATLDDDSYYPTGCSIDPTFAGSSNWLSISSFSRSSASRPPWRTSPARTSTRVSTSWRASSPLPREPTSPSRARPRSGRPRGSGSEVGCSASGAVG